MTTVAEPATTWIVTEPGVVDGMPNSVYHADPVPGGSLSSSGARKLLPPSCPALYRYERDNPPAQKHVFDFGHAAHNLALGVGDKLVPIDADDWRTKAAKEQRNAAHAEGAVPLLSAEYRVVQAMADALRQHPFAGKLFNPDRGVAEQSAFWVDEQTGVWRRARFDWRTTLRGGRTVIVDYKSTRSAAPDQIQKAIHDYGYHCQGKWYLDVACALGLADPDTAFLFVCQEKTPPYLVTVVQLDAMALIIGGDLNRRAIDLYRTCTETNHWPGYADEIELVGVPRWVETRHYKEDTR